MMGFLEDKRRNLEWRQGDLGLSVTSKKDKGLNKEKVVQYINLRRT